MTMILSCPQKHEWEVVPSDIFPGTLYPLVCPECGLETTDPQGKATAHSGGDAAETPTVRHSAETGPALVQDVKRGPGFFPGYEVMSLLGRGAMGVVYKARQIGLDRIVALKILPQGGHEDEETLQRFRTEAKAMAQLHHPNIVQIYDIGEEAGIPYFSLEFVDGGSLAQKLHGKPQPPRQAALLLETLALAIAAAHERGVIHRDLKPGNVLLTTAGQPKITDFGLAKLLGAQSGYTLQGAILGTPSYMAPEQARGHTKHIGPAVDIFALGAILYEALTGRPPFQGATVMETMQQLVHDRAVPARRLRPEIPVDLERIVMKCLEKNPADRYSTAIALAEDLRRFLSGHDVQARSPGILHRGIRWVQHRGE